MISRFAKIAFSLALVCLSIPAFASTQGLNQIPTPDIQNVGDLAVTYRQVDSNVGNKYQGQLEFGVCKGVELSVVQGFTPEITALNAEVGLYQKRGLSLSAGELNYTTNGATPQPFLVAGYTIGGVKVVGGAQEVFTDRVHHAKRNSTLGLIGASYDLTSKLTLQADYRTGKGNFYTAGVAYSILPNVVVNPAVYFSNTTNKGYAYGAVTVSF